MAIEADAAPAVAAAAAETFARWEALLAQALRRSGVPRARAGRLATLAIAAIEGAVIQCRVAHTTAPLDDVQRESARHHRRRAAPRSIGVMSLDPAAQRTSLLASVLDLHLLAEGDEPRAAALTRRIRAASVTGPLDGPSAGTPLSVAQATSEEGLTPSGPTTGETLVQSAHLEETTLVVGRRRHALPLHAPGIRTTTTSTTASGAWTGAAARRRVRGLVPVPRRTARTAPASWRSATSGFLAAHGEGEGAAAIAEAAQAARAL